MDQQICPPAGFLHRGAGPGIPGVDHLSARPGRTHYLMRLYPLAIDLYALAALQPSEERAGRNAQRYSRLAVEAPRPRLLLQRVAQTGHAVLGGESCHSKSLHLHRLTRLKLHCPDGKVAGEVADGLEAVQHAGGVNGSGDGEGLLSSLKGHGFQQSGYAQDMVGVKMGQEDVGQAHHSRPGPHHLSLGSLAAIKEDHISLPVYKHGRGISLRGGKRSGGS